MDESPAAPPIEAARPPGPAARVLIGLVRVYQAIGSPVMGGHCRFQPTCSQYAIVALRRHGALRGSWLSIRRIGRCRPFGGFGFDPVPPPSHEHPPRERETATTSP